MIFLIIKLLIVLLLSVIATTFLGYWSHWLLHQPWSLWFHNAHMNHHQVQYPPDNFFSTKYRNAGKDDSGILFGIIFAPFILLVLFLMWIGFFSLPTGFVIFVGLALCGGAHDYFHNRFHLTDTFWTKFSLFKTWRELHYIHHLDMRLNLGIVFYGWDKLFKTYEQHNNMLSLE